MLYKNLKSKNQAPKSYSVKLGFASVFVVLLLWCNGVFAQKKNVLVPKKNTAKVATKTTTKDSTKTTQPLTLKILSYNIQHGITNDGKTNLLRIVELIKEHKPDLVALQDVDSGLVRSGKLNQTHILSLLTGYEEYFAMATTFQNGKHGLGILSMRPFESKQHRFIPSPENSEARIMQTVLVELAEGRFVQFCNTELDSKSPLNRGLQAAFINEIHRNSIYPVILTGDFKAFADDFTLESLSKHWIDIAKDSSTPTHLPTQSRVDYVWLQPNSSWKLMRYEVLKEPNTAAHQPIVATFVWQ
jgi:endonuclease/exonuclease/phosphatase family metal-dependent hydrolase